MTRLLVVVPTYARPLEQVLRCIECVQGAVPHGYLGELVVVDQNPIPLELPKFVRIVRADPGFPGPRRHLGALEAARHGSDTDIFLFLDDDVELMDWERFPRLLDARDRAGLLARADTGCVQVATRRWQRTMPVNLADTGGGILVPVSTYFEIGGYGEDYLDDLELFARALIRGRRNWRTGVVRSFHRYGAGGLKTLIGMNRQGRAHFAHSRLAERYPGVIERDWLCWSGYRYAARDRGAVLRSRVERVLARRGTP